MLILRIEDRVYGTIVDKIDKVVGITSDTIQPPHPIFGDINIKFIKGVVEKQGELYIILDVVRIFSQKEDSKQTARAPIQDSSDGTFFAPPPATPEQTPEQRAQIADTAMGFIKESLAALSQFYTSGVNDAWLRRRFDEWSGIRKGEDLQVKNISDANDFLRDFHSPNSSTFWDEDYAAAVRSILPDLPSNNIQIWNIGCGKGYETFSFACILKQRYPDGRIKIWANDNDIMAISQAPNMTFELEEVPEYCRTFMSKGRTGYAFNQVIKDSIVFEYHDILNDNPLPDLDMIMARDILSYLPVQSQDKVIAGFQEKLKSNGLVILGRNEALAGDGWQSIGRDPVSAFIRIE